MVLEDIFNYEEKMKSHLEKIVGVAQEHKDELTILEVTKLLDKQIEICNKFEEYVKKAH